MEGRFQFLGTGSSLGVPMIGCECSVCLSSDLKDKRKRSSSLIKLDGKTFLLDVGPDYRELALKYKINFLDGCILTHSHYDHVGGFDDLRVYSYQGKKLPCLMLAQTFQELKANYPYLLEPTEKGGLSSSFFSWQTVDSAFGSTVFEGLFLEYVTFLQKGMEVMGLKIGNLAYISDIKEYDAKLIESLQGIDILIVSALRKTKSLMHFSIEEALAFASLIQPKQVYLTHIAHEIAHETVLGELPKGVSLAYDGLEIAFQIL